MPSQFEVDLAALEAAAGQVSGEHSAIAGGVANLRSIFSRVQDDWRGPAGDSFVGLSANFNAKAQELTDLLGEAVGG
jgi:WXG100 family type VII secretion target